MSVLTATYAVTTRYSNEIKKYCNRLFNTFNLNYFWYCRFDGEGQYSFLGSYPEWCEFFAAEKFYINYPLFRHPECVQGGINLVNNTQDPSLANVISASRERFGMSLWLTLTDKHDGYAEEYGFGSSSASDAQISMLMNDLPLLRLFVRKFREENQFLMKKFEDNQINIADLVGPSFYSRPNSASPLSTERRAFLGHLGITKDLSLSKREVEIVNLLLRGYTASGIAERVFLSKRTVEHHIERVKEKLSCHSKTELIQKARELELYGVLRW